MSLRTSLALLLGLFATSSLTWAQPAWLVKDINTEEPIPVSTGGFPESEGAGDLFYFVHNDGIHGEELWRSDGTPDGTGLVEDICPGACTSSPRSLTASGGRLFFVANDGDLGWRLWKSDGTPQGTAMVTALASFEDPNFFLLEVDRTLYFGAADPDHGPELWATDGTAEGTRRVTNLQGSSYPHPLAAGEGLILFAVDDGEHGREPWVTDGTEGGTRRLTDIQPGLAGSIPQFPDRRAVAAPWGGFLFVADGPDGEEVWGTDGTPEGTALLKDIAPEGGSFPYDFTVVNGFVVFAAAHPANGGELWVSDGTTAGTVLLKDIWSGAADSTPRELTAVGGRVFFHANDGVHGEELWATDGTPAGTYMVLDIAPGAASAFFGQRYGFSDIEGRLTFLAYQTSFSLWESDGTAAGTRQVAPEAWPEPYPYLQDGFGAAGGLFFYHAGIFGNEVWAGDASGPVQVTSAFRLSSGIGDQNGKLSPNGTFSPLGDTLLFQASDGLSGAGIWRSDGSTAGTWLVKDLAQGTHHLQPVNGRMVFQMTGGAVGVTDGTPDGTEILIPNATAAIEKLGNQTFIFRLGNDAPGLWRTDGTPAGTLPVVEVNPTDIGPFPSEFIASGSRLFLHPFGGRLWVSDATQAGSYFLDTGALNVVDLTDSGGILFFKGYTNAAGAEVWRSDGTPAGTFMVKDIRPGPDNSVAMQYQRSFAALPGGSVLFAADDGESGPELWKSDGTEAGTVEVLDILPGAAGSNPGSLTRIGNWVYFSAHDGVHGRELWVSDGTPQGTRMVRDILPGPGSSRPDDFAEVGSNVVFSAFDDTHGREPWRTDGTAAGTRRIQDIAPGPASSSPTGFTVAGDKIFYAANDNVTGIELWAMPRAAALSSFLDVPPGYWALGFIEALASAGVTTGCAPALYCPLSQVTRAEMAVFLERGLHGGAFVPPPATGTVFTDVPANHWAAAWIERLAADGITTGCAPNQYCPEALISRAEMAVFLLRAKHGVAYTPPPASGTVFTDVPAGYWAAAWIEQLAAEEITTGCAPGQFCPDSPVSRDQMAAFLVRTLALPLP